MFVGVAPWPEKAPKKDEGRRRRRPADRRRLASARRGRDAEAESRREPRSPAQPAGRVAARRSRVAHARPGLLRAGDAAEGGQPGVRGQLDELGARSQLGTFRHRRRFRWSTRRRAHAHHGRRSRRRPVRPRQSRTASTSSSTSTGIISTIDTARRTVDEHHQVSRDVIRRSRIGLDRRPASMVRRRRLDGGRPRRAALRQVRRLGGRGQRIEGDETDRRRRGADPYTASPISIPRKNVDRSVEADLPRDERRLDQEVWLRAARAGRGARRSGWLWLDKSVTRLAKAKEADVYQYVVQGFEDSPDAFVAGPDLQAPKQVTTTNPFQSKYAWGRAELVEFKSEKGQRLQGVLRYPAGLRARQEIPDDRLRLREGVRRAAPLRRAVGAGVLQRDVLHERRLLRVRARHRLPSARTRALGRRMRPSRRRRGRADGRRRSEARSA